MDKKTGKKYYIYFGLFLMTLILAGCVHDLNPQEKVDVGNVEVQQETAEKKTELNFSEESFDFGLIKQSGGKVSHDFEFTYTGEGPIKITGVPTSCACTSAQVNPSNLNPGETGVLTIVFNPNLHAEPEGRFFKTAIVQTEPELEEEIELKIWVEIDLDLGEQAFELQSEHDEESEEEEGSMTYHSITAEILDQMLQQKDFTLIDVHIPEQEHIAGTDLVIPYNDIENIESQLPEGKNSKIVLYCRSGGMSRAASYVLAEHGYKNIYDLTGGKNAYDEFLKRSR